MPLLPPALPPLLTPPPTHHHHARLQATASGGQPGPGGSYLGGQSKIGCGQQAVLFAFENFARRMVHQFPTDPTAQVGGCLVG